MILTIYMQYFKKLLHDIRYIQYVLNIFDKIEHILSSIEHILAD